MSKPSLTAEPRSDTAGLSDRHRSVQKPPLHVMIPDCNSLTTATSEPSKTLTVVEPGPPAGLKPLTAVGSFRADLPPETVRVVVSGWKGGAIGLAEGGRVGGAVAGAVGGAVKGGAVVVGTSVVGGTDVDAVVVDVADATEVNESLPSTRSTTTNAPTRAASAAPAAIGHTRDFAAIGSTSALPTTSADIGACETGDHCPRGDDVGS